MQKILIILPNALDPTSGGLERVYHNLTPYLWEHGYEVYATYTKLSDYDKFSVYDGAFFFDAPANPKQYVNFVADIIKRMEFDFVINSFMDFRIMSYLSKLKNTRVIHHVHNVPSVYLHSNIHFIPESMIGTSVDKWTRQLRFNIRLRRAFDRIKANGQKMVILSETFRNDLKGVYPLEDNNIWAIPNPFPIDNDFSLDDCHKEKALLYVGRISEKQKRISSVLHIWQILQNQLPEYRLDIVGDGPDRPRFEIQAKEMGLKRVIFHGSQKPEPFYKKAVISMMTSNFEGFPMVLVEAMQYGCIPFAYDTFTALHDIIDNGENGFILPPDDNAYAKQIIKVFSLQHNQLKRLQQNAVKKSRKFDINSVGAHWIRMLDTYKLPMRI